MNTEKEKIAIERLKAFEPSDGYYLAYSGGKDSDTVKLLAELAGVKYEAHHNLTSVDYPETVKYIKSQKDVIIDIPRYSDGSRITMWNLIPKKGMPPTRIARYCCSYLKEGGGKGKVAILGVRWAESTNRKKNKGLSTIIGKPKNTQKLANEIGADYKITKQGGLIMNDDNDKSRRMVEQCYRTRKTMINPIIDWSDNDVWNFLHYYGYDTNPLYQSGEKRIGCIGCPMGSCKQRLRQFEKYPAYEKAYINAFNKMLQIKKEKGAEIKSQWQDGEAVMKWWIDD